MPTNVAVEDVRTFWNNRAGLGQWAGSQDVLAKQLEIEAITSYVQDGMHVLDMGCGNGITAIELARRFRVTITGIDYASEMVATATKLADGQDFRGSVRFQVGDVTDLTPIRDKFDLIYTERTLINLPDWPTQKAAILGITGLLANNGLYVMCENSQDGLNKINEFRQRIDLPKIDPPWHNRYLRDAEIDEVQIPGVAREGCVYYSSTYYFLSRIVNAWLAAQEGKEPDYHAPINQLALRLPPVGEFGQGRIWLWRKTSGTGSPHQGAKQVLGAMSKA
ncbi:MAG TPA: class I SAM-dependent methyltransferase [Gemmataceae bacterium]|nr:class I SAM-dependent methyltransferase [Gemmataceae bacterium]